MNFALPRSSRAWAAVTLACALSAPAIAQVQFDRGEILKIDLQSREVQIRDHKDRERIWPFAANASVKFSVDSWQNRQPTLKDLRPGMSVHFRYKSGDPEVIEHFDVKDLGSSKNLPPETKPAPQPPGTATGRVTSVDLGVAQVEVMLEDRTRKTFQAANARVLAGVQAGDRIRMQLERDEKGQDIVVKVDPIGRR